MFKENDIVELKSFNGLMHSEGEIDPSENYWLLIGKKGRILRYGSQSSLYADFSEENRLLVCFDCDVASLGLAAHNEDKDSLWILETDLVGRHSEE